MMAMSLRLKANLVYLATAVVLLAVAVPSLRHLALQAGQAGPSQAAALLTAEADVAAQYTSEQVAPLLGSGSGGSLVFVPQATPFYAVASQAQMLAHRMPGYTLRRVVLDPVGREDRPDAWERATINRLRAAADPAPFTAERDGPDGRQLLRVVPLRFSPGICATCYPSRAAAPAGIADAFGDAAGFDRKPGEIVGITVASVPLAAPDNGLLRAALIWLLVSMLVLWLALNLLLEFLVLRPLGKVAAVAEEVSLGHAGVAEFDSFGDTELGALTRSFNRLRRSMESAIGLIDS